MGDLNVSFAHSYQYDINISSISDIIPDLQRAIWGHPAINSHFASRVTHTLLFLHFLFYNGDDIINEKQQKTQTRNYVNGLYSRIPWVFDAFVNRMHSISHCYAFLEISCNKNFFQKMDR